MIIIIIKSFIAEFYDTKKYTEAQMKSEIKCVVKYVVIYPFALQWWIS